MVNPRDTAGECSSRRRRRSNAKQPRDQQQLQQQKTIAARKRRTSLCLLVGCLTSQRHACVSQGRICSDNFMCCHTEIEAADQTFYLTQLQYTDTRPTSPSTDPMMPGTWQGSHWSANFQVTGMTQPGKIPSQAGSSSLEADALTTRPRDLTTSRPQHNFHTKLANTVFSCTVYCNCFPVQKNTHILQTQDQTHNECS